MMYKPIFYRKEGILQRIELEEVLYLEAADNYVKFYTINGIHTVRTTLDFLISRLPEPFVQTHRSYIVAVDRVETIARNIVTLKDIPKKELPVSKRCLPLILKKILVLEGDEGDEINLVEK